MQFCLACHTIILPLPSECLDYQLVLAHLTAEGFTCVSVEFAFVLNFDFSSEAQIQGVIHDRYIVYNCYVPILTMFGRQRLTYCTLEIPILLPQVLCAFFWEAGVAGFMNRPSFQLMLSSFNYCFNCTLPFSLFPFFPPLASTLSQDSHGPNFLRKSCLLLLPI